MGCKSANEKYTEEIIKISKKPANDMKYLIEQIIISTHYDEKDIYFLYKKFIKLEPNKHGHISNTQLLELPEFKWCPFKKHLIRVFKLTPDKETEKQENEVEEEQDSEEAIPTNNRNNINNVSDDFNNVFNIPNDDEKKKNKKNNNFMRSVDKMSKYIYLIYLNRI